MFSRKKRVLISACALLAATMFGTDVARAEFGDIVINNFSDQAGMKPAVFPHWFHRIRFR